jgi:hypothetical protein
MHMQAQTPKTELEAQVLIAQRLHELTLHLAAINKQLIHISADLKFLAVKIH